VVLSCPIFQVEPVEWDVPEPSAFDGLLLTSANAARHAGGGLKQLKALPAHAVGEATAEAARNAGLKVETVGNADAATLLQDLPKSLRLLHLSGEVSRCPDDPRVVRRVVYRSVAISDPGLPALPGLVVAVHSPDAGARLAELTGDRSKVVVAAISDAAARGCGTGWERIEVAEKPNDTSLLALAASLCHTSQPE
jgi:uroporphyrinogen-III synthase